MKLDAHPMLVAVALGLLGPAALETEDELDSSRSAITDGTSTTTEWNPGPAPDPEEFHRVEIEWLKNSR